MDDAVLRIILDDEASRSGTQDQGTTSSGASGLIGSNTPAALERKQTKEIVDALGKLTKGLDDIASGTKATRSVMDKVLGSIEGTKTNTTTRHTFGSFSGENSTAGTKPTSGLVEYAGKTADNTKGILEEIRSSHRDILVELSSTSKSSSGSLEALKGIGFDTQQMVSYLQLMSSDTQQIWANLRLIAGEKPEGEREVTQSAQDKMIEGMSGGKLDRKLLGLEMQDEEQFGKKLGAGEVPNLVSQPSIISEMEKPHMEAMRQAREHAPKGGYEAPPDVEEVIGGEEPGLYDPNEFWKEAMAEWKRKSAQALEKEVTGFSWEEWEKQTDEDKRRHMQSMGGRPVEPHREGSWEGTPQEEWESTIPADLNTPPAKKTQLRMPEPEETEYPPIPGEFELLLHDEEPVAEQTGQKKKRTKARRTDVDISAQNVPDPYAGMTPEEIQQIVSMRSRRALEGEAPEGHAHGGMAGDHPGGPKGSDTIPAWLTEGEFVVNSQDAAANRPELEEINAGRGSSKHMYRGGRAHYLGFGSIVKGVALGAVSSATKFASASTDPAEAVSNLGQSVQTAGTALSTFVPIAGAITQAGGQVVQAFAGLMQAIDATVDRYGQYSPEVAQAQAMAEMNQTLGDMERAQKVGNELAEYVDQRSQLQQSIEEKKVKVLTQILPMVTTILESLEGFMPSGKGIEIAIAALSAPLIMLSTTMQQILGDQQADKIKNFKDPVETLMDDKFEIREENGGWVPRNREG